MGETQGKHNAELCSRSLFQEALSTIIGPSSYLQVAPVVVRRLREARVQRDHERRDRLITRRERSRAAAHEEKPEGHADRHVVSMRNLPLPGHSSPEMAQ